MAQLNPNFEIDFSDINSYEQIQLINDTQLAKENLLMHRAYKEPSDDEIIRNHFSSFTFVDFCPKLFTAGSSATSTAAGQSLSSAAGDLGGARASSSSSSLKQYEMETFSDLFDRINAWLKLNKDWRVVSMETLVYDCTSQFNHLKSSIHSSYLPQNSRGLRLFLSPSKSRFSGPQKIGCINVVPRKVSGSYRARASEPIVYETLDEILKRLNELLLTRPIEGRILSVETITLPMVDGYVNTESNYFMDSRLNLLNQCTYNLAHSRPVATNGGGGAQQLADSTLAGHTLIDILRVYYEFGPMVCGLVNLIDFLPRFYSPTPLSTEQHGNPASGSGVGQPATTAADQATPAAAAGAPSSSSAAAAEASSGPSQSAPHTHTPTEQTLAEKVKSKRIEKIAATESMTRLVRRSLAWFESERKRILGETGGGGGCQPDEQQQPGGPQPQPSAAPQRRSSFDEKAAVNLKLCNLQVHHKTLLKSHLIKVKPSNALQAVNTRTMAHERPAGGQEPIVCDQCSSAQTATGGELTPAPDWCVHLADLSQPYQVRYVRLAYVVPVYNRYARSVCPLRPLQSGRRRQSQGGSHHHPHHHHHHHAHSSRRAGAVNELSSTTSSSSSSSTATSGSTSSSSSTTPRSSPSLFGPKRGSSSLSATAEAATAGTSALEHQPQPPPSGSNNDENKVDGDKPDGDDDEDDDDDDEAKRKLRLVEELLEGKQEEEERAKQAALDIVNGTIERHFRAEEAHQLQQADDGHNGSPIGQLTYRLFAPCQLVKSSSCFSINPVNSSSPLARRGSVDINGSGNGSGISSENAHPSTLLLGPSSATASHSSGNSSHHAHVVTSFGAFFPSALSHDLIGGSSSSTSTYDCSATGPGGSSSTGSGGGGGGSSSGSSSGNSGGGGSKFTTNEFEPVDAIRRRMEIYVTTNSMKVIAGETLIVNLSDALSCLSTAIEQTIVKASFAQCRPTTWVSVYVLYAAVDEPQLPGQLLAQQKLRELALIDEAGEEERLREAECIFDDDFKGTLNATPDTAAAAAATTSESRQQRAPDGLMAATVAGADKEDNGAGGSAIRIEQNPVDSSLTLYNSAYDRTVALPTRPENNLASLEPIEFLGSQADCLWVDENELILGQQKLQQQAERRLKRRNKKGAKSKKSRHESDSQCSIM